MNNKKIVVTSRSFSAHPKLREELLALFPNTKFNDEGTIVDEKTLAEFFSGACGSSGTITAVAGGDTDPDAGNLGNQGKDFSPPTSIYGNQFKDGPSNKEEKWKQVFGESRYLKCRGEKDIKKMKVYKICRWNDSCPTYSDAAINDNGMYVGRIQVNMNDGRKRKFLYFQADYNTRK